MGGERIAQVAAGLFPGCRVLVKIRAARGLGEKRARARPGRVVLVHPRFVTVDHGAYRESYGLADVASGRVRIEPLGEG